MAEEALRIKVGADIIEFTKSIAEVEKEIKDLSAEIKNLSGSALVNANKRLNELTETAQRLKNIGKSGFDQFGVALDKTAIAAQRAGASAQGARPSFAGLSQVLRDSGNFAISTNIGLLAISNNLPTLIDDFGRFRQQLNATNGASVGFLGTLRRFAAGFIGSGGLTILLGAAATAIPLLIAKFSQAGQAAKKASDDIKSLNDVLNEAAGGGLGQTAQIQGLINVFADVTRSTRDRKRALEELRQINQAYFGDLTFETASLAELTKRQNELNQALIQEAIIKGAKAEIEKLGPAYAKAAKAVKDLNRAQFDGRQAQGDALNDQGVRNFTVNTTKAGIEQAKVNQQLKNAQAEFNKVNGQIQEFIGLINDATSQLVTFKDTKVAPKVNVKVDKVEVEPKAVEFIGLNNTFNADQDIARQFGIDNIQVPLNITVPQSAFDALKKFGENEYWKLIQENTQNIISQFDEFLTPVINTAFEALGNGTSIIKAIGQSMKALVLQIGATIAKAAILAAILNTIFPGGAAIGGNVVKGFGSIFKSVLGFGNAALPQFNGGGVTGGGLAVNVGGQFNIRGTDLVAVVSQGNQRVGRVG